MKQTDCVRFACGSLFRATWEQAILLTGCEGPVVKVHKCVPASIDIEPRHEFIPNSSEQELIAKKQLTTKL